MLRRLLVIVLVLVVLLVGAAAAALFAAPSLLTPRLEAALTRASGHAVTIRGGVGIGWNGGPELRVRDLGVANAAWGSRPEMLTVPALTVQLDGPALLGATVRVAHVRVEQPDLLLETDAAGHGNWQTAPAPSSASPSSASPSPAAPANPAPASGPASGSPAIQLGTIAIEGGRVAFRDGRSGRLTQATLDGTADAAANPVTVAAKVHATSAELGADLHVDGTVDRAAPMERSSLSVTGSVTVPDHLDIVVKLVPGQAGQTVTAQANGAGLAAAVAGVLDPAAMRPVGPVTLDATLAAGSPLPARFSVPMLAGPASLHVLLRQQGDDTNLRDLRLALPEGDLAGDLDVALAKPILLHGSLTSRRIDLEKALAAFAPPPAASPPAAPAAAPTVATAAASPATLPLQVLERVNADLHLAVAELHDSRVTIHNLTGHVVIQDGRLVLDPVVGTGPGGQLNLAVRADGRARPPALAVVLDAPALALQPFLVLAGLPGDVTGAAAIHADLHAAGATQPELLPSLAGRVSVSMGDGDIDLTALSNLVAAAHLPIDARGRAHLRCLVMRAEIARGVAQVNPLVIDATRILVQGSGSVDLVQRTLSLRLQPLLRTGPGLVVPIQVSGPWSKPKIDVDRGNLAGALAGLAEHAAGQATGQAAGSAGDACKTEGIASAAPLPTVKALKPAELLKSLLR